MKKMQTLLKQVLEQIYHQDHYDIQSYNKDINKEKVSFSNKKH